MPLQYGADCCEIATCSFADRFSRVAGLRDTRLFVEFADVLLSVPGAHIPSLPGAPVNTVTTQWMSKGH